MLGYTRPIEDLAMQKLTLNGKGFMKIPVIAKILWHIRPAEIGNVSLLWEIWKVAPIRLPML